MIDHLDKQTTSLPLEIKRGRGRPKSGNALTPAQKQKAYRERKRGNVTANTVANLDENIELRARLLEAMEEIESLKSKLRAEYKLGEKARKKLGELEEKLKSNVTENQITGAWVIQKRGKNSKKWTTIGDPIETLDGAKAAIDYMQNKSISGEEWTWRAMQESGLTYTTKASR